MGWVVPQPQRGGTAIACPVIEPPSHGATAPGGPMTGPALDYVFAVTNNLRLIPGLKLCKRCLEFFESEDFSQPQQASQNKENFDSNDTLYFESPMEKVYTPRRVISALSNASIISPVVELERSNSDRRLRICSDILDKVKRNVLESENLSSFNAIDYKELLDALREKVKSTKNRSERLSLLTLAPSSLTLDQINNYFAHPPKKRNGHCLTDEEKSRIIDFYTSDDCSRQLPGMKNVKSVKQPNGKRLKIQKRLLLINIKELYDEYKKKYSSVGANIKLMLDAAGFTNERHYLMDKLVCSVYNKISRSTRGCPKADSLETYLEEIISDESEDPITYKKWAQTDGTKLETVQTPRDDFIESLVIAVGNLTTHHYVARNQSAHFVKCKEELDYETCVLVSDFSENFSFNIQDSIQGYNWANDQATLLPFLGYMKMFEGTSVSVSMVVISDHLTHDTLSVHSFLRPVLQYLKKLNPSLKK
uniref:Uncharacterized protein n=1 Tax=Daphnia galeata TaxID=27404 RepID=A0A8J2RJQ9_9CRUS|nr:unnamed protein product [Daphnia galeata]